MSGRARFGYDAILTSHNIKLLIDGGTCAMVRSNKQCPIYYQSKSKFFMFMLIYVVERYHSFGVDCKMWSLILCDTFNLLARFPLDAKN